MTIALAMLAAVSGFQTPRDQLLAMKTHYTSLDSFSMAIEHHDSSGLFPGDYAQSFAWKKPSAFELKVTKRSSQTLPPPALHAPDYYCTADTITTIQPNGPRLQRPLIAPPNTSPGWEVSGGLVVSWLLNGGMAKSVENPPAGFELTFSAGQRTEWKGEKVTEVVIGVVQRPTEKICFFLGSEPQRVVGIEWTHEGKTGWAHYRDQKMNPTLPAGLGTPPK